MRMVKLATWYICIGLSTPLSCMTSNYSPLTMQLQNIMNKQYLETTIQVNQGKCMFQVTYCNPNITSEQHHYLANQRGAIVNLVSLGADPEVTNGWGETCLARAVLYNDLETAKYLLQKGANPNAKQGALFPLPLIYYVTRLDIAKLLVSYGLIIRSCSQLLHNSMSYRKPAELVAYYISCGADTCEQDTQGNTPLHILIANMCDRFQAAGTTESLWISKAQHLLDAAPQLLTIENKKRETPPSYIMFGGLYPKNIAALVQKMHALFKTYRGDRAS